MSKRQEKKFKKLVNSAESYIIENAEKVLSAVRNEKLSETNPHKLCQKLLEDYKPLYKPDDKIKSSSKNFKNILERFCIELQNYQAMPKAINYNSFYNDKGKNNKILNCVYEFFSEKFNEIETDKEKYNDEYFMPLYRVLEKNFLKKDNSSDDEQSNELNNAWKKYSHGLMDVLIKIKGDSSDIDEAKEKFVKSIKDDCDYFNNVDGIIKEFENDEAKTKYNEYRNRLKNFNKDIFGMGNTLTFDFFKELKCENLIKDDLHIMECYKLVREYGKLTKQIEKNKIVFEFISMCKKIDYTPFYVDKILWLCCTGNFYKDGIIITKMNRKNFLKKYKSKRKKD